MEISVQSVHDSRENYHRLASDIDEAEGALKGGLGCSHKLIAGMTTATSAMSIGMGDTALVDITPSMVASTTFGMGPTVSGIEACTAVTVNDTLKVLGLVYAAVQVPPTFDADTR